MPSKAINERKNNRGCGLRSMSPVVYRFFILGEVGAIAPEGRL